MKNPCYKCRKRKIGCHATCEEYIKFKELLDEHNTIMRKEKNAHNDSVGYDKSRKRRLSQAHGKK